jgi:rubrerythrin
MADLKGSKTHDNLKAAFAGESQANRRYLYFAKIADVEGYPEVAGNFRDTAEGETGHAHGHLDYLKRVGDPATDLPIGDTASNLRAAVAGETHEYTDMYPGMARTARDEGLRRSRGLVRDAGQGREVARRPVPEAARRHRLIPRRV